MFVENGKFDHDTFTYKTRVTKNKVIDRNYYPVKEAENSNMRHRPVGLGVQGLADAFIMLRLPLHLTRLKTESRNFETLYFCCCNRFYGNGKRRRTLFSLKDHQCQRRIPVQYVGNER
jgi:hypothetical protein